MPEKIQKLALEYAGKALVNHPNDNSDMAEYIKNEFEKKFGPYWACFGIYELILKFENNAYFYFFFFFFIISKLVISWAVILALLKHVILAFILMIYFFYFLNIHNYIYNKNNRLQILKYNIRKNCMKVLK